MGRISNFYEFEAWRESHKLVLVVYKMTEKFPKEEKYGVVGQLKRAASSIAANIAEGFGGYHFADKVRFYYQARGSASEVQNFLCLAKDLNYIDRKETNYIWKQLKSR